MAATLILPPMPTRSKPTRATKRRASCSPTCRCSTLAAAATITFVEHGIGDVLVTFEAEVQAIGNQYGKDKTDLVIPPVSLRADFPVAVVDKVVDERGSRKLAETYLQHLYRPEA